MSQFARDKELSEAYLDILNGYTKCFYGNKKVYIRHFGVFDQALVDENYQEVFDYARGQGLPTEEDRLRVLDEDGFWTKGDERKIEFKKAEIKEQEIRLSKTIIKKQKEKILKNLSGLRDEIREIELKRVELLHDTCESFANGKSMNYMIWLSFYKDKKLKKRAWLKEEFDELSKAELNELVGAYNGAIGSLSDSRLKKISVMSSFTNYFYLASDNVSEFFGKKILDLTFYQTILASYGKLFKNIQENNSDIPDSVMGDPDAMIDFAKSKSESGSSKAIDTEGGYSRVGATKEDMIDAGVSSSSAKDLHDIAKDKGGNLGWEDFATMR
jgi:hypothetical protein